MVKGEFHIDMSKKFKNEVNVGIACCSFDKMEHRGCALNRVLVKKLHCKFCNSDKKDKDGNAKLYAATIYCLIEEILSEIKTLVICCDEDPQLTKKYLLEMIDGSSIIEIISIREYREMMGNPSPKIKSMAHRFCNMYRKRAQKQWRWEKGIPLNVIKIGFNELKEVLN